MEKEIYQLFINIATIEKLDNYDKKKLWKKIEPICYHPEFQKRCQAPFFHHDIKTLGEHIIADTIITYKMINKLKFKNDKNLLNKDIAIYIAMFHDLYEVPWQNNKRKTKFMNKHGFIHPIEAVVNAITWFPEYFIDKKQALMIIDGIIHHMHPLAVRAIDNKPLELNNQEKFDMLNEKYKKMIKMSTDIGKIGHFSLRKTFFLEGIIMSKADKRVALKMDLKSFSGFTALISGNNKKIK